MATNDNIFREKIYKLEADYRIFQEILDMINKNVSDMELKQHVLNETDIIIQQSKTWGDLCAMLNSGASFNQLEMYCRSQSAKLVKEIAYLKA